MNWLDYSAVVFYFIGLVAISLLVKGRIRNSSDMFIAGRNSSWWLSGVSSYMTVFSASTFVVWGGVAYKSGLVAAVVGYMFAVAAVPVGLWIAGKWRKMLIESPGEYLAIRFGKSTVNFYTISGIVGRGVHTATALYAVSVILSALTGLNIWLAILILGIITLGYTVIGGFLAVLLTDFVQFAVLLSIVLFLVPLSLNEVGGIQAFIDNARHIPGFLSGTSHTYTWLWLVLWAILNVAYLGGDFPFVQRYISVPTRRDAQKSIYLVGTLYLITPLLWYLPAMVYRILVPGPGMDVDPAAMTVLGESAYVEMGKRVLMNGMLGIMLAAMLSATMSMVSGTLNVYANVYTCDIWGSRHKEAQESQKIRAGRMFTMAFGLLITAGAMLIPFAGGAEKVVVTILTMILCPLYIPSLWGLFSRRLTGRQLIIAMLSSWAIGITARFALPAEVLRPSIIESFSGCIIPIVILTTMEIISWRKGSTATGAEAIQSILDPNSDRPRTANMVSAARTYSNLALTSFCTTIGAVALLLSVLLMAGDQRTVAHKGIVLWFVLIIAIIILSYVFFRVFQSRRE